MSRHCGWCSDLWQWFFFSGTYFLTHHFGTCKHARMYTWCFLHCFFFFCSFHCWTSDQWFVFKKKKKKKIPWNIPFAIGRKAPHVSPATFQKRKKNRKKIPLCVRFAIILWSIVCWLTGQQGSKSPGKNNHVSLVVKLCYTQKSIWT